MHTQGMDRCRNVSGRVGLLRIVGVGNRVCRETEMIKGKIGM